MITLLSVYLNRIFSNHIYIRHSTKMKSALEEWVDIREDHFQHNSLERKRKHAAHDPKHHAHVLVKTLELISYNLWTPYNQCTWKPCQMLKKNIIKCDMPKHVMWDDKWAAPKNLGFYWANLAEVRHPQSRRGHIESFWEIFPFSWSKQHKHSLLSKSIWSSCAQPSPCPKGKKTHPNWASYMKDIGFLI